MKVFITGGAGFVGGHIISELLRDRHEVVALVRNLRSGDALASKGVTILKGDVLDRESVKKAMGKADAVIHLVGIIVEAKGEGSFEQVHFEGTKNVVDVARLAAVKRYIQMSALGAAKGAKSRYHQTKYKAEEYVRESGIGYTIFKPSVIHGRGDAFVNMYAKMMRLTPFVPVIGNGKVRMQPVYVKDIAKMYAKALTGDDFANKTFEVGGPERLTFDEIIDTIARVLQRRAVKVHIPVWIMGINAMMMKAALSRPPVGKDQLMMLESDNVCDNSAIKDLLLKKYSIGLTIFADGIKKYLVDKR